MSSVASRIGSFKADPSHGSFRAWLLQNVRWKIVDQLRKRTPFASAGAERPEAAGTATTSTVDRVPDVREMDLEGLCDAEWRERLRALALKELQGRVRARHFQIFHLLAVENRPPSEVARLSGCNRAVVYLVRHRVGRALDQIVKDIEKKLG